MSGKKPKDEFDILDLDEEPSLDDPLGEEVDAICIDKTKPTEIVVAAAKSDAQVDRLRDEFVECVHKWAMSHKGYDRCLNCATGRLTHKQKQFIYSLWTDRYKVMTKEAAEFIDNLSIGEASAILDARNRIFFGRK